MLPAGVSVDPIPTNAALAPATSTARTTANIGSFLELHVGKLVAAAAGAIAEALGEFQDGGLTSSTNLHKVVRDQLN